MVIKCKLFGQQLIEENNKKINLPQGKLTGLFYYILINKIVSRDEAANLFWPNSNEKRAKTSLRNALHKIRNCFDSDIILSPNKFDLLINEDLDIQIDSELLEKNPLENYESYSGEFLKGLYINELIEFDYWLNEMREYYFRIYKNTLEKKIELDYESESFKSFEEDVNLLISLDRFNERAYYFKLLYFKKIERFDKVINEYHYYQNMINKELGVSASKSLVDIYNYSLDKVKNNEGQNSERESIFFKREYELKLMEHTFKKFLNDKAFQSILITGESGIGKTVLVEKFYKRNSRDFKFLNIQCNYLESNIPYFPWLKLINIIDKYFKDNNIKSPELWDEMVQSVFLNSVNKYQPSAYVLENSSNVNMEVIYNALLNGLSLYSGGQKLVVFFDDIHLADKLSIDLMVRFILSPKDYMMFLLSLSNEADRNMLTPFRTLEQLNKLLEIVLQRFTKQEVSSIVYNVLGKEVTKGDIDNIYSKSKGNSFFLNEYINIYSQNESEEKLIVKLDSVLQEKFSRLSRVEIDILKILSVFYEPIALETLINTFEIEPFDVLKCIENLTKLKIVEESNDENEVLVGFTYSAYKKYIYNTLNESSRKIIHLAIANDLEGRISDKYIDISLYNKLEKHFKKAGNKEKYLKYKLHKLNYLLNFSHEVFPIVNDYDLDSRTNISIKNDKALRLIDDIELEIIALKNQGLRSNQEDIINEIEMVFLYCKGRYLIRCGKYSDGIRVINRLIHLAKELDDKKFEVLGRKQLIIYGIQINDKEIMIEHIIPGIKLAKEIGNIPDIGVLYRLYGLYYLMVGEFEQAEKLFMESINIFLNTDLTGNKNSISIAANYNYIAEIKTAEGKFDRASEFYSKSISLAEEIQPTCISVFYINSGINSLLIGDMENMKDCFLRADSIIKKFDSYWKKPVLDSFLALVKFIDGDYKEALALLEDAESEIGTINNSRDIGMVYFVHAIISNLSSSKASFEKKDYLKESLKYYYNQAIKYLDPHRDKSTIEYLENNIIL